MPLAAPHCLTITCSLADNPIAAPRISNRSSYLTIHGRRDSSGSRWNWTRTPSGPRRPLPTPPLVPVAGGVIIALLTAGALLALWLTGGDGDSSVGATASATPMPSPAAQPSPTSTPVLIPAVSATPMPTPAPVSTPTPTVAPTPTSAVPGGQGPLFGLAVWDDQAWRFEPPLEDARYREGEAVPFLLRISRADLSAAYPVTIRYDCESFDFLTTYNRDHGTAPALALGGPGSAAPDATVLIPDDSGTTVDDGESGSLSLWGASFSGGAGPLPPSPCSGEKTLIIGLTAKGPTVHLIWAAQISAGTSARDAPLRLTVEVADAAALSMEIDPESVQPAP